jgi:hypothetical protein
MPALTGFFECLVVWRQPWEAQERLWTVLIFFRRISNAHEWCWSCFSDRNGMWGNKFLLHFCFSLYWSKLLLEILWALLKLFLVILCLYPILFKWLLSWPNRFYKDLSVEQIRLILRGWLYDMLLVTRGGWQLLGKRYWLVSLDLEYASVDSSPPIKS